MIQQFTRILVFFFFWIIISIPVATYIHHNTCGRLRGNNSPLRLRLGRSIDIFSQKRDTQSLHPMGSGEPDWKKEETINKGYS